MLSWARPTISGNPIACTDKNFFVENYLAPIPWPGPSDPERIGQPLAQAWEGKAFLLGAFNPNGLCPVALWASTS